MGENRIPWIPMAMDFHGFRMVSYSLAPYAVRSDQKWIPGVRYWIPVPYFSPVDKCHIRMSKVKKPIKVSKSESDLSVFQDLLDDVIAIAVEESKITSFSIFLDHCNEYIPPDVAEKFTDTLGCSFGEFCKELYEDRFAKEKEIEEDNIPPGCCEVCERHTSLTRHHLYPQELHKKVSKKTGISINDLKQLSSGHIALICRMCHSTIHRLFSNEELAESMYTVDLLLEDEGFFRYAKWASKQGVAAKGGTKDKRKSK